MQVNFELGEEKIGLVVLQKFIVSPIVLVHQYLHGLSACFESSDICWMNKL